MSTPSSFQPSPEATAPLPSVRPETPPQPWAEPADAVPNPLERPAVQAPGPATVPATPRGARKPGNGTGRAEPWASGWRLAAAHANFDAMVLPHSLPSQMRIVLTAPTVASFDLVRIDARWRTTLLLVLLSGALAGIGYNLGRPAFADTPSALGWGVLGGVLWALVAFTLATGLIRACARLFGGRARARVLAYNLALGVCPLVALAVLSGLIPFIGPVLSGLLLAFALVVTVFAVISAERLDIGRAMGAVLLALGGMMLIALLAALVVLILVVFTLHGTALR